MTTTKKVALTGIKPTGAPHLGNMLGMIHPALALQEEYKCLYFIADLHSLNMITDAEFIQQCTYDCVASWIALGLDVEEHLIYRQSDVPMVTEYTWYLANVCGFGFLEKAHAFKDAQAKGREINVGMFMYPVLMAADILMYDADVVPVGKDQKQHVEMARDMAGSFNAIYGEGVMKPPQPLISEEVQLIPGSDGQKMSKSYNNTIPVFCSEKQLKKSIMGITTDSTALEDPKSMNDSHFGTLFKVIAGRQQYDDLEARLNRGGLGWGHAKLELFETLRDALSEPAKRYQELREDIPTMEKILKEGAEKAHERAQPILQRVRDALKFS